MELLILALLGFSVALDCFAVSACITSVKGVERSAFLSIPAHFAGFQVGMALAGYYLGAVASRWIEAYDHWIAFGILAAIGVKMIVESINESHESVDAGSESKIILLSLATSIDALVIGLALSVEQTNLLLAGVVIGGITFALSLAGMLLGKRIHDLRIGYIGVFGGIILIAIGVRTLLSHL